MGYEPSDRRYLARFAWLSIAAALVTIFLKSSAYMLTGSVGLLSDALESLVNLAGACMALAMLRVAARPADEDHAFGHSKAEYFASGSEGTLILVAAGCIAAAAVQRLFAPKPLEQLGVGLAVSAAAALVNLGAALVILRAGKRHRSVTLEANAHHLLTDVWTSGGVLVGVGAVALTGWLWLDPVVALLVAANIIWAGSGIVRTAVRGLMDSSLPEEEQQAVRTVLDTYAEAGIQYHALRTRRSGARRFVDVHILVPSDWSVGRGHQLLEEIEADLREALPDLVTNTHLEPLEDPTSWDDVGLDRKPAPRKETGKVH